MLTSGRGEPLVVRFERQQSRSSVPTTTVNYPSLAQWDRADNLEVVGARFEASVTVHILHSSDPMILHYPLKLLSGILSATLDVLGGTVVTSAITSDKENRSYLD